MLELTGFFMKHALAPLVGFVAGVAVTWVGLGGYYEERLVAVKNAADLKVADLKLAQAADRIELQQHTARALLAAAETITEQQQATQKVENEHESELATLRAHYAAEFERMRQQAEGASDPVHSDTVPTLPGTAQQLDEAACDGFPQTRAGRRRALECKADVCSTRLIRLQSWIRKQSQIGSQSQK